MPTIQDIADQVNAKLDSIIQNTSQTSNHTAATNSSVKNLDSHVQIGLANLSQGLFSLIELQKVSIALQDQNRKQNDTIICLLENSNVLLCGITRKLTRQLELSEGIVCATRRIEGIEERVHAAEVTDYDRLVALNARVEECCPPEQPPLEPCPEPCGTSDYRAVNAKGQDWRPLPTPRQGGSAEAKPAQG
jgi:hypothetical protein